MMALKGLAKLGEECNEVGQIVCKAAQVGGIDGAHWSGDLRDMLELEMGDVLAAIEFATRKNNLDRNRIWDRRFDKFSLFLKWDKE